MWVYVCIIQSRDGKRSQESSRPFDGARTTQIFVLTMYTRIGMCVVRTVTAQLLFVRRETVRKTERE